jgi:hypothetical protein
MYEEINVLKKAIRQLNESPSRINGGMLFTL